MYDSTERSRTIIGGLADSDFHTIDELNAWLGNKGTDIVRMYGKNTDFDDIFMDNMSLLLQSIINSPLPLEFSMERLSMYLHSSFSMDSPLWHVPDSFLS